MLSWRSTIASGSLIWPQHSPVLNRLLTVVTASLYIWHSQQHLHSELIFSRMPGNSLAIPLLCQFQPVVVMFQLSPGYPSSHPHLATASSLSFLVATLNTLFCTQQRHHVPTKSSSQGLRDGTQSELHDFCAKASCAPSILTYERLVAGGMLTRWSSSSLSPQSRDRAYSLPTETVG